MKAWSSSAVASPSAGAAVRRRGHGEVLLRVLILRHLLSLVFVRAGGSVSRGACMISTSMWDDLLGCRDATKVKATELLKMLNKYKGVGALLRLRLRPLPLRRCWSRIEATRSAGNKTIRLPSVFLLSPVHPPAIPCLLPAPAPKLLRLLPAPASPLLPAPSLRWFEPRKLLALEEHGRGSVRACVREGRRYLLACRQGLAAAAGSRLAVRVLPCSEGRPNLILTVVDRGGGTRPRRPRRERRGREEPAVGLRDSARRILSARRMDRTPGTLSSSSLSMRNPPKSEFPWPPSPLIHSPSDRGRGRRPAHVPGAAAGGWSSSPAWPTSSVSHVCPAAAGANGRARPQRCSAPVRDADNRP
nr:unnamed protein product [Digitaria exilis]